MTNLQFLGSMGFILTVMAVVALVEAAIPLFARPANLQGRLRGNLAMTMQTLVFAFVLSSGVALLALMLPVASPRLLEAAGLSESVRLVLGVVALDFAFGYVAHRTMHAWPSLWRFHRVHHSDPFVDVTTSYRTHPVESVWRHLWLFGTVWLLGVPAASVVVFRVLSGLNGLLEHANIRVAPALDSALSWIWVTPNMHKIHHSRQQTETDTNYGNLLPVYDRLLGTFVPTSRALTVEYGLEDAGPEEVRSFGSMLAMPWKPHGDSPQRSSVALPPPDVLEMRSLR
jgi:sterol desaturase/sphingolipid hydroxylase (fatty acid hydroxylase superfamily)